MRMTTTDIANAIGGWKSANGGQAPSFHDLLAVLGCNPHDLMDELEKAEQIQAIYVPSPGHYDIVPGML